MEDTTLGWRFVNPRMQEAYPPISLGETAECVADRWTVSRERQDAFALESQRRAVAAIEAGRFAGQLVPVSVPGRKGAVTVVDRDEHPRPDTLRRGAGRRSSPRSRPAGRSRPATARASTTAPPRCCSSRRSGPGRSGCGRWRGSSRRRSPGVHPDVMGIGPVPAVRKALVAGRASTVGDLDVVEINEAFASQSVACMDELGLDPARVNPNGGAIALGHPLGASGARLVTMLVHELARTGGRYGLATMCIGVGQGIATVVERIEGRARPVAPRPLGQVSGDPRRQRRARRSAHRRTARRVRQCRPHRLGVRTARLGGRATCAWPTIGVLDEIR